MRDLTSADAARGIRTRLVAVDDGRTARSVGAPEVDDPADYEAAKAFVDAACSRYVPQYVVLLGSSDVVPHLPRPTGRPAPPPQPGRRYRRTSVSFTPELGRDRAVMPLADAR